MNIVLSASVVLATLQVTSPAFTNNGYIPKKYSCEGESISPALQVTAIPAGAVGLAVIVEDPDAPQGTVTHWIAWNLDVSGKIAEKTAQGVQGKNTKGKNGYMGPCPPDGVHHYHFTVYALDAKIDLPADSDEKQLKKAMEGHILGSGELVGLYTKENK